MTEAEIKTLISFIEKDDLPRNSTILFLNGWGRAFWPDWLKQAGPVCYNPFKIRGAENEVRLPENIPEGPYDMVLALLPKNKIEAKGLIALGHTHLKDEGSLVVCAANDKGGKSLHKELQKMGLEGESAVKHKARAVKVVKTGSVNLELDDIGMRKDPNTDLWTYPGIYGWDKIDTGSRLLADNLPDDLTGMIGDFGCGNGYLTRLILERAKPDSIFAIDNDARALVAAQKNIPQNISCSPVHFLWADCTRPNSDLPALDAVVMNPPFHSGKQTDISVGHGFIKMAANHLKPGGRLFMVANTHLAYEKLLKALFSSVEKISEDKGYKILKAEK